MSAQCPCGLPAGFYARIDGVIRIDVPFCLMCRDRAYKLEFVTIFDWLSRRVVSA